MSMKSMEDVLLHEMSDLLSAEQQFAKALTKVKNSAVTAEVKQLAAEHYEETQDQIENLKQAFRLWGRKPEKMVCRGAEGICKETSALLTKEKPKGNIKDVLLVNGTLRIEHYEIAGYTTAIALAKALKATEVMKCLQLNLREELATCRKLEAAGATLMSGGGRPHGNGFSASK